MEWKVGQRAVVVRHRNGGPEVTDVEVVKVGRKWVTVRQVDTRWAMDERFTMEGRSERQIGYGARLWRTREDFEAERRRDQAWSHFSQIVRNRHSVPPGLSTDEIERITALIKDALS